MKILLIYHIGDFPEMGGGTYIEEFDDMKKLEARVNELNDKNKPQDGKKMIDFEAYHIFGKIPIEPIEVITKLKVG